jgi:DNA repair protein RadA/Sms
VVLVGHVTKDGAVAGPRTLEHLVDVVCQFEGDRHSRLRLLRATKNRFGPTDEVGCFDLNETGIVGLADPSGLFVSHAQHHVPGTCVTVTLEGRRPLATEVQALVAPSMLANPRRTTSGVDGSRLAMVLAVLQRRAGLKVADQDVYVSTVGGARVVEPAADLALALATVSSWENVALPSRLVAVGEVGLAGEIRPVTGTGRRLAEAARLGFTHAVVPAGSIEPGQVPAGMTVAQAGDLLEAVRLTRAERRGRADDGGAGGGDRDGGARDRDGDARGRGSATGGRDGGVSGRDEAPGDEDAAAPGF